MIVAIGLIGVFLSGFLLGGLFGYWTASEDEPVTEDRSWWFSDDPESNPDEMVEFVLGDVPPSWTGDALR